jgi:hypothetical protein
MPGELLVILLRVQQRLADKSVDVCVFQTAEQPPEWLKAGNCNFPLTD